MTVALVASAVHCFTSQVSSGAHGVLSFNAGGADFLAVVVSWEDYTSPAPAVLYNDQVAQVVTTVQLVGDTAGCLALYALAIDSPDASAHDLRVQPTPNYAGWTSVLVASFSGSSQRFGAILVDEYGTADSGVEGGSTTVEDALPGSLVLFSGFTTFGVQPLALDIDSAAWTELGRDDATNLTAFAAVADSTAGGDYTIAVSETGTWFNLRCLAFEVTPAGTPINEPDVEITATHIEKLLRPGNEPATCTFDVDGGDILVVAVMRSNSATNVFTGAQIGAATYGGRELRFLPQYSLINETIVGVMDLAIMMSPPDGEQEFWLEGFTGNVGFINAAFVALRSSSGVVGVRHASSQQGNANQLFLGDSKAGSLMLAIEMATHTYNTMVGSYGWELLAFADETGDSIDPPPDPPTQLATWIFAGRGEPGFDLVLTPASFSSTFTIALEFQPELAVSPEYEAFGEVVERPIGQAGAAAFIAEIAPAGQLFHAYHTMWQDWPSKAVEMMQPDDFWLAHYPPYLSGVALSFAKVQATYVDLNSDVRETMGLVWPGSATLLRDTIALLKQRCPQTKVYLAIQQWNFDFQSHEPYDPGGWGGLNSDHLNAHQRFCEDMNLDGIVLDYEVVANGEAHPELEYHCYTINGLRYCYTDTEQMSVITAFREHFPRPFELFLTPTHVGAYGEGEYTHTPPDLGWNSGYQLCLHKNPEVAAMLDGFHLMTYDAGNGYDPRQAVRAYQHYFPDTPLFLGVRVGPADFAGVKITARQFRDYANTCIMLGLAGAHMYSTLWDVPGRQGIEDGDPPPYGDYNGDFPDGNVAGGVFARVFGLAYGGYPRLNNRKLSGSGLLLVGGA